MKYQQHLTTRNRLSKPGHVSVLPKPRRHWLDPADLAPEDGCIQEDPMTAGVYLQRGSGFTRQ